MPTARRAAILLAGCCAFWGLSFPCNQFALAATARIVRGAAPGGLGVVDDLALRAGYNGLRFLLAGIVYAALVARSLRGVRRVELLGGVGMGALFSGGLLLQLLGLRWTVPSVSALLTALSVVLTPIAQALVARRPVGARVWSACAIALAGIALLAAPNPGTAAANTVAVAAPWPHLGELATVAAAVLFTGQIFAIDRWGGRSEPARFTIVAFAACAALGLATCVALGGSAMLAPHALAALARDPAWSLATAANVLLASVIAFHVMNTWQPRVSPAVAAVVYCSEPPFALLWSLVLGTERLTALTLLGSAVVLVGVLLAATARREPA